MDITDYIAIYAAGLSTILGLFEIYKYFSSGPRLRLSIMAEGKIADNMHPQGSDETYMVLTVTNVGDRPITINMMFMKEYKNRWRRFRNRPNRQMIVPRPGIQGGTPLPQRLDVGEQWAGMAEHSEETLQMMRAGHLWIGISTQHLRKDPMIQVI